MSDYNFKAICVDIGGFKDLYTKGKIYDIVNGILTWDDGDTTSCDEIKNIERLNSVTFAKFELIEENKITKSTLQDGDIVKLRNEECFTIKDSKLISNNYREETYDLKYYSEDLKREYLGLDNRLIRDDRLDIMEVYRNPIFKQQENRIITIDELLNDFDKEFKEKYGEGFIVAR